MKKFLALMIVVCIAFTGFISWKNYAPAEPEVAEQTVKAVDLDALYATHRPDEVVMKVGADEITWDEYFYFLSANVSYMESMFYYYGGEVDWNIVADEATGETMGENMWTLARDGVAQIYACTRFAEENGAKLTAEQEAELDEELKAIIARTCGEGAGEADFDEYLRSMHATRGLYDMMSRWDYLDGQCIKELYGENAESISDEDAQAYIDEQGYAQLNHILFMTMDISTGEQKDEAASAAKQEAAQAVYEELAAVENAEERVALFNQRKEELDEDTGKVAYPNGYIATPDAGFVQEFLDGGYALENYQVSEPVKSDYGYHVMLRLPVTPDTVLDESTGDTARTALAKKLYNQAVIDYMDGLGSEFVQGFTPVSISDFVR